MALAGNLPLIRYFGKADRRKHFHIAGDILKQDLPIGANLLQIALFIVPLKRDIHYQRQLVGVFLIPPQGAAAALRRADFARGRVVDADFNFVVGVAFRHTVDLYQYRESALIKFRQRLFAGVGMISTGDVIAGGLVEYFCQLVRFVLVRSIDNHLFALYRANVRVFAGQIEIRQLFTDAV